MPAPTGHGTQHRITDFASATKPRAPIYSQEPLHTLACTVVNCGLLHMKRYCNTVLDHSKLSRRPALQPSPVGTHGVTAAWPSQLRDGTALLLARHQCITRHFLVVY
jgi:hypothetical protein